MFICFCLCFFIIIFPLCCRLSLELTGQFVCAFLFVGRIFGSSPCASSHCSSSAVMPQLWYALAAEQGGTGAQSAPGGPVGFFWKTTRSAGNGLVLGRGMLAPAAPQGWWGRVPGACVCQGGLESCASWREEWWWWEENSETSAEFLLN